MTPIIPDHQQLPGQLPLVAVTDLVRLANCPVCWQRPGKPCTITGAPGSGLEVIAEHVIIRDGAR